ncbi:MAG: ion channel [Alphaproteobacteria bacterium]
MNVRSLWQSFGYFGVLISYIIIFTMLPIIEAYDIGNHAVNILFTAVLLFSLYAVSNHIYNLVIGIVLLSPFMFLSWSGLYDHSNTAQLIKLASQACFMGYTIVFFMRHILHAKKVNTDIIIGSICVYLFLGTIWGILFTMAEYFAPGSFAGLPDITLQDQADIIGQRFLDMLYYSYITLTTLGYGNIYPVSGLANSLSSAAAIMGQMYLTVLIAMLIGKYRAN